MNSWLILGGLVGVGLLFMSRNVIGSDKDVYPDNFDALLIRAARKYNLPAEMVKAVAANESMVGKFTNLEPIGGTTGIMHIKISTAKDMDPNVTEEQLRRPDVDIDLGVKYLRWCYDRYKRFDNATRTRYAVMAYNGGPGRMDQIIKNGEAYYKNEQWLKNMTTYWNRYAGHYKKLTEVA